MTSSHDDLPHPVPPFAYLRWKENWFFIIMDPERAVHGVVHFNFEPSHDRARFSCHMSVRGRAYKYLNECRFPDSFAWAREIGDGRIRLHFSKPSGRFNIVLAAPDLSFDLTFEASLPTFDFAACRFAAPDVPSFQEVMTLGTNLPYNHQQQALTVRGTLSTDGSTEPAIRIAGVAYRDHSWCMRSDGAVASHTWSALHLGRRAFGVKRIHTAARPEVWAREGYVSDAEGERVLKEIEVLYEGRCADGLPQTVRFELGDVLGEKYTVSCDVSGRYAQVPLISEKPGAHGAYGITENFCPCVLEQTGETGCALVEIGSARPEG
jgi:hypothetical protein